MSECENCKSLKAQLAAMQSKLETSDDRTEENSAFAQSRRARKDGACPTK